MRSLSKAEWRLVDDHLDLARSIARSMAFGRGYLMPRSELVDQLEDAALDGLIAAACKTPRDGVSFRTWAGACIKKKCLEKIRSLFASKRSPSRVHPLGFDPTDHRPGDDGSRQFAELVASLSSTERQILSLRFLEDRTQVETGDVLGISDRAVRRVEARAFDRIRRAERVATH